MLTRAQIHPVPMNPDRVRIGAVRIERIIEGIFARFCSMKKRSNGLLEHNVGWRNRSEVTS